ncbi:MAG TPA: cytochrome c [Solirubrobacterales bacterium]
MPRSRNPIRAAAALLAVGSLLIAASGCGTSSGDAQRGRALFIQRCGTCHTLAEAGTSAQVGPNLDDAFAAARTAGEPGSTIEGVVKSQVDNPRPSNDNPAVSMPPQIVSGQDLDDVAAYVGAWAGVPGAAPPEIEGGPGAQVFASNGCSGCHTLAAAEAGGTVGPNLDEVLPGQTAPQIEESIVDPEAKIEKGYPAGVMPSTFKSSLSPKELEQLVEYLITSTSKTGGGSK